MTWSLSDLRDLLTVIQLGVTAGLALLVLYLKAKFVTREQHQEAIKEVHQLLAIKRERLAAGEARFVRLEEQIKALPTRADIISIKEQLANVAGELRALGAHQEATRDVLDRLHATLHRHEEIFADAARGRP